ncbi:MAG: oligosaccharide repeat unit polymerase [Cytophagaceae bacterium]|nr:MAG: oligosaccharide repeat unit polymerase [Cytophagaceae bacterium]
MASSTQNRLSEYLPLLAFVAAWTLQLVYFLGYDSRLFFSYGFSIASLILLAVASYAVGFLGFRLLPLANFFAGQANARRALHPRTVKLLLLMTVALSSGIIAMNIVIPLARGISLSGAREIALEDWENGGVLPRILSILTNVTIAFSLMAIIDQIDIRGKFPILLVALFALLTVAAYSRAHLLLGLSVISTKWISQSKYRVAYIFIIFVMFAALFSILSVIASVGSADRNAGLEGVFNSLEVYTFGGVAGFEFYYNTGFPQYNSLLTVPRFIYSIIPGLGNLPPSYFPFIDTVPPINVFSALYPPYHDFGKYGLIIFFFIYGALSSVTAVLFQRRRQRYLCLLSGFFLYAALMSPFDDQFIRGLTILILMITGAAVYALLYRLIRNGLVLQD